MAYEDIDLDAIESNKDEAPDYRPLNKSAPLDAPVQIDARMRYIATLQSEESSRYEEFARIADGEGLGRIAKVFRDILREEESHSKELQEASSTMTNLRTAITREESQIEMIKSVIKLADREKDRDLLARLEGILEGEQGHIEKLERAMSALEKQMKEISKSRSRDEKEEQLCHYGICVPKPVEED